jgi:hypothetical protein
MPTLDASHLGTKCCTHKLVKLYYELILNPQGRRSEHLLITVGNREINSVFKSLGIEIRDRTTFQKTGIFV